MGTDGEQVSRWCGGLLCIRQGGIMQMAFGGTETHLQPCPWRTTRT